MPHPKDLRLWRQLQLLRRSFVMIEWTVDKVVLQLLGVFDPLFVAKPS